MIDEMSRGVLMKDEIFLTQFYSSFLSLCKRDGMTPSAAAKKAGISSGAPTAWKNGAVPKPAQRDKLCKLFSVSDDELLGYKKEKPSADGEELTPEEKELYEILDSCGPDMVKAILEVAKIIKNREGG